MNLTTKRSSNSPSATKKAAESHTAIILAAGRGRRLGSLTRKKPKCLIEINGTPILHRQLAALQSHGIKNIFIVVGFMAGEVERYVQTIFHELNVKFVRNRNPENTNTLYSLALAAAVIGGNKSVIQLNGDVVFDPKILGMLLQREKTNSHAAICYKRCGKEEIKILLAKDGSIAALNKKIKPCEAVGEAIGINKFSPPFWSALSAHLRKLEKNFAHEYFEYAIERTIAAGKKISPLDIGEKKAVEIDFPKDIRTAQSLRFLA